jgi:hypothetical protein
MSKQPEERDVMKQPRDRREVDELISNGRKLVAQAKEKMADFERRLAAGRARLDAHIEHLRRTGGEAAVEAFNRQGEQVKADVQAEIRREQMHGSAPATGTRRMLSRGIRI